MVSTDLYSGGREPSAAARTARETISVGVRRELSLEPETGGGGVTQACECVVTVVEVLLVAPSTVEGSIRGAPHRRDPPKER